MNFLIQRAFAENHQFVLKPPIGIPTDVCVLINNVTNFLVGVSIPIAGLMILYGAFLILTAAGSPERFKTAKNTILYAIIGLVVVLLSKGLVVVITELLEVNGSGYCVSTTGRDYKPADRYPDPTPTTTTTLPQCNDNKDNDNDTKVDKDDPDCGSIIDNSEAPDSTPSSTPINIME